MPTGMRPFRDTIPLDQAREIIREHAVPIDRAERLAIGQAGGRVVARDVVAHHDVPPFSRAAMDGYAVRAEDTRHATRHQPRLLAQIDRVFTGQVPGSRVGASQCIEIATGAPLPDGADAVVMVEETDRDDRLAVSVFSPVEPGQNVGRRGSDISKGQVVLASGDLLGPSRIGALAAMGIASVEVFARPRVAILSTGNEIVDPGETLRDGQIYDVNKYTLSAVVAEHGGIAVAFSAASDDLPALRRALDACLAEDVVVFSGGSSVGERDLVLDVIRERGRVLFHGIAVKPGKPTAFGLVSGKPVFGMPGYPTSCLSNAYLLLVPLLRALARLPPHRLRTVTAPLGRRVVSPAGRHQFFTVRLENGVAMPAFKASGDITSMSQADGYFEIAADTDVVDQGTIVEVKLF
jgi:molybdenum cofactor synthesis domain-containing protein